MADGDGGVGLHQEQRHWLAYDVAAAEYYGVRAFERNISAFKNLHDTQGSASDQIRAACDQAADVYGMKAVDVLRRVDRFEDSLCVHLRGERELDEDAVDVVAMIQIFNDLEQFPR